MKLQKGISAEINKICQDKVIQCIIEEIHSDGTIVARSYKDAPEVDGLVYIKSDEYLTPGDIVDTNGVVVGRHEGIMYYTIGQRHGLGIGGPGEAWFVCGKDVQKNQLIVGQGTQTELLYANRVIVTNVNIINGPLEDNGNLTAKFRYRQADIKVNIKWLSEDKLEITTTEPSKAITPGQFAVIYDGEYCLGGGIIDEVYMDDVKRKY